MKEWGELLLLLFLEAISDVPVWQAIKIIFLCQYLQSEALRREIHACLNVIENWNVANSFIFNNGCIGDFATNRLDEHDLAALSPHLLQICLVYVNILRI